MAKHHFRTRAELERQMDAARQLRAETLAGGAWIIAALISALLVLRRVIVRSTG
ncbi:MAG TPA: hypothetical protein VFZ10_24165 [Geminicoccaceae bacterium]